MDDLNRAEKDFLTGFYTREHLVSALLKRIIDAKMGGEKFSILLVDIDRFKEINDKYGHIWGDEFLKYVSSTLRLSLDNKGSIFRYGGDEFVVLFSTNDPREAFSLAKQFNKVLRNRPFVFNGRLFRLTVSCGLATYPDDASGAEDLLQVADRALYFSKRYGRNTTTRAGRMRFQRFKIISLVFLEVLVLAAIAFSVNTYIIRRVNLRFLKNMSVKRLFPVGIKADTEIVLTSGDVILGRIISEDEEKLVVSVALGRGECTMTIEKMLIQSIRKTEVEKEGPSTRSP